MYARNNKLDSPRKQTTQECDLDQFRSFSNSSGSLDLDQINRASLSTEQLMLDQCSCGKIDGYKHPCNDDFIYSKKHKNIVSRTVWNCPDFLYMLSSFWQEPCEADNFITSILLMRKQE